MDFALTREQAALAAAVRDLIAGHADLGMVRAVFDDPDGDGDPAKLWEQLTAQGWTAVLVPERHGGLGLGLLDAAVIVRELGRGVVPGPFLATLVAGEAIRTAGSAQQQERLLPALAAGQLKLAAALRRPSSAWSAPGDGVEAVGDVLTGEVAQVEYAHVADLVVVAARAAGDLGLWLVDPGTAGVTITRTPMLDATTRTSTLTLSGVSAERLPGAGAGAVSGLLARGAAVYANDLAGIAREALTRTVDHVTTRQQFGRPVGAFQALQHTLADLLVAVTMAEHAAWYAAHALDEGLPDAALAVSVAKAKASDVARDVTAKMIQYHGGIGYTWEHHAHFFYKRAKREEYVFGDASTHRAVIARLTLG